MIDLLNSLLRVDPATRIGVKSTKELKEHPFFKDLNWESY